MTSLVDEIERLGRAVAAGDLTPADAAHRLQQFSDGGLTYAGAERLIATWDTARATYADIFRRAAESLARMGVTAEQLAGGAE